MTDAETRTAGFRAHNLRWLGGEMRAVHDRDNLARQPDAALAGAASGEFATAEPPQHPLAAWTGRPA